MITAKEIAKKLNLSEAAVSMALHNKAGVSTKTKKKVIDMAVELGYDFSRIKARSIQPDMNGSILSVNYKKHGAVVNDTAFFSELSEYIHLFCNKFGYYTAMQYFFDDTDIERKFEEYSALYKGIILLATEMNSDDLKKWRKCPIPFVVLDSYHIDVPANYITINNRQGAYLAASHLIKKSGIQPGYLQSAYPIQNFKERTEGFFKAILENGMSAPRTVIHRLMPSVEGAYADMTEIIKNKDRLASCYFADNDLIAIGAMKAFKEHGFQIPKDISIIGFDDIPMSACVEPPLSSVHVPIKHLANTAVKCLAENIQNNSRETLHIEAAAYLQIRKS